MDELEYLEARIDNVSVSNLGFIVLLRPEFEDRVLPIFIGANEAHSIAVALNKQPLPRPLTHDLLKSVVEALDAELIKVHVTALADNTFYARIYLRTENMLELDLDSRPSDAIALALRYDVPIYVHREVFDAAAVRIQTEQSESEENVLEEDGETDIEVLSTKGSPNPNRALTENQPQSPVDRLKSALALALAEERYEDAAKLRDELKRLHVDN